jgi:hypothetical protein
MTEISRRFARLVIAAVEHPAAVNPNAVPDAASGFLDAAPAGMAHPTPLGGPHDGAEGRGLLHLARAPYRAGPRG